MWPGLLPILGWNCLAGAPPCSVVRPAGNSHAALLSAAFAAVFGIACCFRTHLPEWSGGARRSSRFAGATLCCHQKGVERWQWCWALLVPAGCPLPSTACQDAEDPRLSLRHLLLRTYCSQSLSSMPSANQEIQRACGSCSLVFQSKFALPLQVP